MSVAQSSCHKDKKRGWKCIILITTIFSMLLTCVAVLIIIGVHVDFMGGLIDPAIGYGLGSTLIVVPWVIVVLMCSKFKIQNAENQLRVGL
jgi:hypothetical protein